jgi:hypothetical protein
MPNPNNEFWKLCLTIGYRKTKRLTENIPCSCQSKFCIFDNDCRECNGTGFITREVIYPEKPKIPEDLVIFLEKCYKEWCEGE